MKPCAKVSNITELYFSCNSMVFIYIKQVINLLPSVSKACESL